MKDRITDIGMPGGMPPHHHVPKLSPQQRESLAEGYIERREKEPDLKVGDYARSVCSKYGVTAAYVRQLVMARLQNPY